MVRPLSMTSGEAPEPGEEAQERETRRKYARTTTLMVFDHRSLAAEQEAQQAAQAQQHPRPAAESLVLDAELKPAVPAVKRKPPTTTGEDGVEVTEGEEELEEIDFDDSWAISGTCRHEYWSSPGSAGFKVRGSQYLVDKKKILAAPPMFELVAVDLLEMEEPMYHLCKHLPSVRYVL